MFNILLFLVLCHTTNASSINNYGERDGVAMDALPYALVGHQLADMAYFVRKTNFCDGYCPKSAKRDATLERLANEGFTFFNNEQPIVVGATQESHWQGYIAEAQYRGTNVLVIGFPGTETLYDFGRDIQSSFAKGATQFQQLEALGLARKEDLNFSVGWGFNSRFEDIWTKAGLGSRFEQRFKNWLEGRARAGTKQQQSIGKHFEVWVVGHSLGGALAHMGAMMMALRGLYDPLCVTARQERKITFSVRLITFGSPRTFVVGDADRVLLHFAPDNPMRNSYFRFVNYFDMIPSIPPRYLTPVPYKHVGGALYIHHQSTNYLNLPRRQRTSKNGYWKMTYQKGDFSPPYVVSGLWNHCLPRYWARLKAVELQSESVDPDADEEQARMTMDEANAALSAEIANMVDPTQCMGAMEMQDPRSDSSSSDCPLPTDTRTWSVSAISTALADMWNFKTVEKEVDCPCAVERTEEVCSCEGAPQCPPPACDNPFGEAFSTMSTTRVRATPLKVKKITVEEQAALDLAHVEKYNFVSLVEVAVSSKQSQTMSQAYSVVDVLENLPPRVSQTSSNKHFLYGGVAAVVVVALVLGFGLGRRSVPKGDELDYSLLQETGGTDEI